MQGEYITDSISSRIRHFRLEKEYSQEYMAEKLGMTQPGYSRTENNAGEVSINKLDEIAKLLEVSLNDLVNGRGISNYSQNNSLDNHEVGGNIIIHQHSDEKLKKIEELLEKLTKKNERA